MTTGWFIYLCFVGSLLALAARALNSATRAFARPTRWVWAAALAGLVGLTVIAPQRSSVDASTSPIVAPSTASSSVPRANVGIIARARAVLDATTNAMTDVVALLDRRVSSTTRVAIAVTWLAASALLLAIWVTVNLRLIRARRGWPAQRLHGLAIRVAPNSGPAVLGVLRAEIVVPRSLLERSDDQQLLILAHEREHLRARDHLLLAGAWLVTIAFPWHPAVWYLLARLRLAIELDCDARLLRSGVSPRSYGRLLIDVAAHHGGIRIGALALADRPSHLERRILAMNAPRKRHALAYGTASCALGALLVLGACEAKVPTAAELESMNVETAEKSAVAAGYTSARDRKSADYFVNGVQVTAEQAHALEGKDIGSLEVVKSERPTGRDTIFVTTRDKMPDAWKRAGALDPLEKDGLALKQKLVTADSTEHLAAHVARQMMTAKVRERADADHASTHPVSELTRVHTDAHPMFMIDGRKASESAFAALAKGDVASVAVYKGGSAREMTSDPDAKNGVIYVTTKDGMSYQTQKRKQE